MIPASITNTRSFAIGSYSSASFWMVELAGEEFSFGATSSACGDIVFAARQRIIRMPMYSIKKDMKIPATNMADVVASYARSPRHSF